MVTLKTTGVQATPCIHQQRIQLHRGPSPGADGLTQPPHLPRHDLGQTGANPGSLFPGRFGEVTSIKGSLGGQTSSAEHGVAVGAVFPPHVSAGGTPGAGKPGTQVSFLGLQVRSLRQHQFTTSAPFALEFSLATDPRRLSPTYPRQYPPRVLGHRCVSRPRTVFRIFQTGRKRGSILCEENLTL